MTDINLLVLEAFNTGASFYDSESDKANKDNISIDRTKMNKASSLTGISQGVISSMQKFSGGSGIGGVDKFLNRPSIDVSMIDHHSRAVQRKAAQKFNKIMGEKVI